MADQRITAADANRSFSKLLRAAREGKRMIITSHGQPVAELGPVGGDAETEERARRRTLHAALVRRLQAQAPRLIGSWTRDDLHAREQD